MFNIPSFSIPGMMPTAHPTYDNIVRTNYAGAVNYIFSNTEEPPSQISFRITDYTGNIILQDDLGDYYSRTGTANAFVFGGEEPGYIPVGTHWLWILVDGQMIKRPLHNEDNGFNLGQNSFVYGVVVQVAETETETCPGIYDWPEIRTGDTFSGITSMQIVVNGAPPTYPIVSARIHFRTDPDGEGAPALELSTPSGITIVNAATWTISIPGFLVTLPPAVYYYDLETVDSNGQIRTYVAGYWDILEDVTN